MSIEAKILFHCIYNTQKVCLGRGPGLEDSKTVLVQQKEFSQDPKKIYWQFSVKGSEIFWDGWRHNLPSP